MNYITAERPLSDSEEVVVTEVDTVVEKDEFFEHLSYLSELHRETVHL